MRGAASQGRAFKRGLRDVWEGGCLGKNSLEEGMEQPVQMPCGRRLCKQ